MDTAQIVAAFGFLGAVIGGYAYLPQINHLIKEKCSAGISPRAFTIWSFSSALVLVNAIYIRSAVFILICTIQLVSSLVILTFGIRNKDHVCASHLRGEDPLSEHSF